MNKEDLELHQSAADVLDATVKAMQRLELKISVLMFVVGCLVGEAVYQWLHKS